MIIKDNNTFTQKVLGTINKRTVDKNGYVSGKMRFQETRGGGISLQYAESAARSLIRSLRRDMRLNGSEVTELSVCGSLAVAKSIEDVMLDYKYSSTRQRIAIDAKTKQVRIAALSGRIKKSYAALFGMSADSLKSLNLNNVQVLAILTATADFLTRSTQKYIAPAAKPKASKSAKPKANKSANKSANKPAQITA